MTQDDPFDPRRWDRQRPAWHAAARLLSDLDWHSLKDLRATMIAASDLQEVTCDGILREGVRKGVLMPNRARRLANRRYRVHPGAREEFARIA